MLLPCLTESLPTTMLSALPTNCRLLRLHINISFNTLSQALKILAVNLFAPRLSSRSTQSPTASSCTSRASRRASNISSHGVSLPPHSTASLPPIASAKATVTSSPKAATPTSIPCEAFRSPLRVPKPQSSTTCGPASPFHRPI